MPMYDLLEYSKNYSKTTGSDWNYYRDEPNSGVGRANNNIKTIQLRIQNLLITKQVLLEN